MLRKSFPWTIRLYKRDDPAIAELTGEVGPMRGTPYVLHRGMLMSPFGVPCSPLPWGELIGVDLRSGDISWRTKLGSLRDVGPIPLPAIDLGIPNIGGSLLTGGGLVFIGASLDHYLKLVTSRHGRRLE